MKTYRIFSVAAICVLLPALAGAADNLRVNPNLNLMKNGRQGRLILGDHMDDGIVKGEPNYIIFYAGFCYNAKRQAARTVELYNQYKDRVHFVVVDWSGLMSSDQLPAAQRPLSLAYFRGNIPHTTILDKDGKVVFNYTGEADDATLMGWLDSALRTPPGQQAQQVLSAESAAPSKTAEKTAER